MFIIESFPICALMTVLLLLLQKKQLDEGMVFFLASLPVRSFAVLKDIYSSYEQGSLIKLPKSKTGVNTGRVDCKYVT